MRDNARHMAALTGHSLSAVNCGRTRDLPMLTHSATRGMIWVPTLRAHLTGVVQCLLDPFSTCRLGHTVTEIVHSGDFNDSDLILGHFVLEPELAKLYVAHLAKTSAAGYALGCAGIRANDYSTVYAEVAEHSTDSDRNCRALY